MAIKKEYAVYLALREKMQLPPPWEMSMAEYRLRTLPIPGFIGEPEPILGLENRIIPAPRGY